VRAALSSLSLISVPLPFQIDSCFIQKTVWSKNHFIKMLLGRVYCHPGMVLSTTQVYKIQCNNNPSSSNNREILGKDSSVFGLMLSVCFRGKEYRLQSLRNGPRDAPLPYASLQDPACNNNTRSNNRELLAKDSWAPWKGF
jgi:hypothetical protein